MGYILCTVLSLYTTLERTYPIQNETPTSKPITRLNWTAIILLAFSGQLAWGVENQYFNAFVYDNIIPDPRRISWMVAASAITATLTTILMGTLSDRTRSRWGKRKLSSAIASMPQAKR